MAAVASLRVELIVTRLLVAVAICRLAMSDGRQAALAGTLIGPSRQASQTPLISVAPDRERTMRRHCTFTGRPLSLSSMLVPQDVPVRAAVAATCVAPFAPWRTMAAVGPAAVPVCASQYPPAPPARAA